MGGGYQGIDRKEAGSAVYWAAAAGEGLPVGFHSSAKSATNRSSSTFRKHGGGSELGGLDPEGRALSIGVLSERIKALRREVVGTTLLRATNGPDSCSHSDTLPAPKHSSHGREAYSLHPAPHPQLGSGPGLAPAQPPLRPVVRHAGAARGLCRIPQRPLAGVPTALHPGPGHGLRDASRPCHVSRWRDGPAGPRPVPPAEQRRVGDQADPGQLEGHPGRQPLLPRGADGEDQGRCGGDHR